jgi:hypothetical protein
MTVGIFHMPRPPEAAPRGPSVPADCNPVPGASVRRRILRDNGLSIVLASMFVVCLGCQIIAGRLEHNADQRNHGEAAVAIGAYLGSAHFWEALAENWESEFLQLFGYVMLTAMLYQRGSAESKDPDEASEVDRSGKGARAKPDAPWPVRRGGLALKLYEHSLSLAFLLLFLATIAVHAMSGAREFNADQAAHGAPERLTALQYAGTARFWFESMQNWQSEFLALLAMVVLSIFLRERGSPESKPVDAPHSDTGGG